MNQNEQSSTALVAIDLSAAFDLVNHSIYLERLDTYYGINGMAFRSYLSGRTQRVVIKGVYSKEKMLDQGVPQGSVLGARLYTLYIRPLSHILENHRVLYHTDADDTQLYVKFDRESHSSMQKKLLIYWKTVCWMLVTGWHIMD